MDISLKDQKNFLVLQHSPVDRRRRAGPADIKMYDHPRKHSRAAKRDRGERSHIRCFVQKTFTS